MGSSIRLLAAFAILVGASSLPAQVPEAQGRCVSGCGQSSGSSAQDARRARAHAEHMKRQREWEGILGRWQSAAKKGAGYSREGQKELAKGKCAQALDSFQRELAAFQSVSAADLERADNIWGLDRCRREGGKTHCYGNLRLAQEQRVGWARERIAGAQSSCVQPQVNRAAFNAPGSGAPAQAKPGKNSPGAGADQNRPLGAYGNGHQPIGSAGSVKGNAYWLTDNGAKVPIKKGAPLFRGARIVTEEGSHLEIQLLDQTTLKLGPNSDMRMDEFVYDPTTTAGKIAASLVKGTFRWVTGNTMRKDPENMKVKLAVVAIGIRGTDFEVKYEPGAQGYIKLSKGELQITPNVGSPFPMKPHDKVTIQADGSIVAPGAKK